MRKNTECSYSIQHILYRPCILCDALVLQNTLFYRTHFMKSQTLHWIQSISYRTRSLYICQTENYWKLLKITGNYSNYISYGVATILRSSKIHVSFAKEPYERDLYSTKRPSIFKEPTHRRHAVLCIRQNTCNRMYSTLYSILYSIFCMCLPTVATPYYAFCKI